MCKTCGNIDTQNPCTVCIDQRRDPSVIVVVADVADLWALERAHAINARYHVLGGTLSPLDGIGPQDLTIDALVTRAHAPEVKEVILALNATVDGQTTAHYITDLLHGCQRQGDAPGAWRAGRRRARLSRRGHARRRDQAAHGVLGWLALSLIFSENRDPLFGIMLVPQHPRNARAPAARPAGQGSAPPPAR